MARHDLTELYSILMESRFEFMGQGEASLPTIYTTIKSRYPELCDDSYLCAVNCQSGHNQPEWRHVVRTALTDLKKRGQGIMSGSRRQSWMIGASVTSEQWPQPEEFVEGRELHVLHRRKERNPKAVRRKKQQVLAACGRLLCEACDFDFEAVYGPLGKGFAECHHRVPLSQLVSGHKTKLSELAIICANCHRILHKSRPMMSIEQLRALILSRRAKTSSSQVN
jgi:predicted HNH restriction endonuclease